MFDYFLSFIDNVMQNLAKYRVYSAGVKSAETSEFSVYSGFLCMRKKTCEIDNKMLQKA